MLFDDFESMLKQEALETFVTNCSCLWLNDLEYKNNDTCCIFWPAFGCWVHPKGGQHTFLVTFRLFSKINQKRHNWVPSQGTKTFLSHLISSFLTKKNNFDRLSGAQHLNMWITEVLIREQFDHIATQQIYDIGREREREIQKF